MTSRTEDVTNAAELMFGSDFRIQGAEGIDDGTANVQVLCNDEVFFLLEDQRQRYIERGSSLEDLSDTFKSLHSHLEKMVTTKNFQDLQKIAAHLPVELAEVEFEERETRRVCKLHPYEKTSLINLLSASDTTPEEVRHWIPSFIRFDDEQIQKAISLVIDEKEKIEG
jgi:hypothetical protein